MSRHDQRYEIVQQGHWWVTNVYVEARLPGTRAWRIHTEQKRPTYFGGTIESNPEILIGSRDGGGSLGFREGEDGEEATYVRLILPKPLPWLEWRHVISEEKWSVYGVSYLQVKFHWSWWSIKHRTQRKFARKAKR